MIKHFLSVFLPLAEFCIPLPQEIKVCLRITLTPYPIREKFRGFGELSHTFYTWEHFALRMAHSPRCLAKEPRLLYLGLNTCMSLSSILEPTVLTLWGPIYF